jgi:hypothetical protein
VSLNSAYIVKINTGPKQVSRVMYILLSHASEKVMEIRAVRPLSIWFCQAGSGLQAYSFKCSAWVADASVRGLLKNFRIYF